MRPRVYLPLLLAFASIALPQIALAALVPLVPCGITDPTSCQFCDIAKLVQNIINFSIQLSIPIAIVLFSFAGVSYATAGGNPGKIQAATKIFSRVAVGFLLVLSSWLIINTILAVLLGGSLYGNGKWFTIPCVARTAGSNTVSNLLSGLVSGQTGLSQTSGSGQGGVAAPSSTYDDSAARQSLSTFCTQNGNANCITTHSSGNCSDPTNASCTSLSGLKQDAVQGVELIQAQCGCSLVITGGTETGHASEGGTLSHSSGSKLDLQPQASLDSVITSWQNIGARSGDNAQQYKNGNTTCARESDHWDCTFSP